MTDTTISMGDGPDANVATTYTSNTSANPGNFTATTTTQPTFYTAEDLEKARRQEKDKLYDRLETLKGEVDALKKDRDVKVTEEENRRLAAEAALRKQSEEEMDVRTLLQTKETEWQAALQAERAERERALALLDQERRYQEIQTYRTSRIEQEREAIIPQLIDFVSGDTPDEIEASIAVLRERSADILDSAQQAMTAQRAAMPGARVTAPPAGPLDTESGHRLPTAEELAAMPINEYAKVRQQLIRTQDQRRGGLFG